MDLFANAAYGVIPGDYDHRRIERFVEKIMDGVLLGEDIPWAQALEKASKMEPVRKIITELGFPDTANLIGVEKTEDGCALEEGTIIIGWGLLAFPEIAYSDGFRRAVQSDLDLDWHLWVST